MSLINDRKILISVGNHRRSVNWQPQTLLLSELYEKMRIPARSPETMQEYLNLKKSEQDDLKDVGGYVAGGLVGTRRKAGAVAGRDVITLDLDNIPPSGTEDVLRRVEGLGCGYCVYSTRKHSPSAPRLRVLLPLDRTATADEYEPLARKMADTIGMELADPTTFDVCRLMYWPSTCVDSEYIFNYTDKPMLSVDGLLALYEDWRDVTAWPRHKAEVLTGTRGKVQIDPTTKDGVIGAFCRVYDVPRAIAELIPDTYAPVDTMPSRYTYANGSTTGGAVLYDGGKFLYSHHATDPCGGIEVNAFDLVRLHKFEGMDDEAKPQTPTHKLPSYAAMCDYAKALPEVHQLFVKEAGELVQLEFSDVAADTKQAEFLGSISGEVMTTGLVKKMVAALHVEIRENEITHKVEINGAPPSWTPEKAVNQLPVLLLDYLKLAGVKGATKTAIVDTLEIIADESRYNPVTTMLVSAPWDGVDRISEYYGILGVTNPFHQTLILKWLWQSVALAFNGSAKPYGGVMVLTFQGSQQIGKTAGIREIVPFPQLFKEGADINPREKDTIIESTSYWITELGEIDKLAWRDQASLKAFLTANVDEYRSPYDRKAVRHPRRTSFYGTVNPDKFLSDETGNLRYAIVPIERVDLQKLFSLTFEWKIQLWCQAYQFYLQNPQGFRLTADEHTLVDRQNRQHEKPMEHELEIRELFRHDLPEEQWGLFTAGEVARLLPRLPSAVRVGWVLSKLAREDERIQVKTLHKQGVYTLPIPKLTPPHNGV